MDLIALFSCGHIPATLPELADTAAAIRRFSDKSTQVLAIVVAKYRTTCGASAVWLEWARAELNLKGAHLHHLRGIGDMFLRYADCEETIYIYKRLFALSYNKLLPLTRIPAHDFERFLNAHELERMSREEVRNAVNRFLHLPAAPLQPELPGLSRLLNYIDDNADGLSAVAEAAAVNPLRAERCLLAGLALTGGALEPFKKSPATSNRELLESARMALAKELEEVERALASISVAGVA